RAPDALRGHVGERLVEERVPVAHTDEHGQRHAAPHEVPLEPACLGERERAERRAAPGHPLVVARHLLEALGRDAPPARDDLEEGSDLVGRRGAAERDQEDRVDGSRRTHRTLRSDRSWTMSTRARTCSTGVPGKTPWPRLKMWPGRLAARSRMSFTRGRMCGGLARGTAGPRGSCTPTAGAGRGQAVSGSAG